MKSVKQVLENLEQEGVDVSLIQSEVAKIFEFLKNKTLFKLGSKQFPPKAY